MMLKYNETEYSRRPLPDKHVQSKLGYPVIHDIFSPEDFYRDIKGLVQEEDFEILPGIQGAPGKMKIRQPALYCAFFLFLILLKSLKTSPGIFMDKMENAGIFYR